MARTVRRKAWHRSGDELEQLMVICSGRVRVEQDGQAVEELAAGHLIGGMPF